VPRISLTSSVLEHPATRHQDRPICKHGQVGTIWVAALDDVPVLVELLRVNRGFLAALEPVRSNDAARRVSRIRR